ncbi:UDP-glucuronosyltransferase 2A2-like [Scomber japonicus]|uniref:UDP-glucuronosyltransferase 2A2-like n=1 Tax=Scomber japonicus TaxID=13676 RepID=UPI002305647E|nr:UDP-glucuronosyltransferase 2A2-like [Scomber japonicus]
MDIMIKALHARGHSVDVVRTNKSWYIRDDSLHYNTITVPVSEAFNHDFINPILKKIIDIERGESSALNFASLQLEMFTAMFNMHRIICKMATNMLEDNDLMKNLKESKYDMVFTDPAWAVCDEFFGQQVRYSDLLQGADLWLMRVDFVFEFPRPTMPNVIYIGGFQCKPSKPLPQHLEEFVQSSGEHGVIIMSLGTFVSELPADITNNIAAAFATLPQKVIWRHKGDRPAALGNNTIVVDWMPQNDLLGHPKTKLFVAHGGTNGLQEAIYHGVPVVGIPVFFDQYDNLLRLKERGAAKILTINTAAKDNNFLNAILEVLNEPSYRINMQRLSMLHRDQPVKPLDNAIFWIEFVMRHKGAAHLRTESYRLPWYSFYSVDVVLTFLATVVVIFFLPFVCLRFLRIANNKKANK